MPRREIVEEIQNRLSDSLKTFDGIAVLTNCCVLRNLLHSCKQGKKVGTTVREVIKNIGVYCESKARIPNIDVVLRKATLNLRKKYREFLSLKQRTTKAGNERKKDFNTMLGEEFLNGRYMKPQLESPSVETPISEEHLSVPPSKQNSTTTVTSIFSGTSSEAISTVSENKNLEKPKRKAKILSEIKTRAIIRHNVGLRGASKLTDVPRSTLDRKINKNLKKTVAEAKQSIDKSKQYILHFDGKAFKGASGFKERNCYVVTRTDIPQELVLGVPYLQDKKADTISQKGFEVVGDWGIQDCITGLSMDTTATNTGCKGGVCKLLQELIGRELIWFPCRHHVAELVLGSVIQPWEGSSTGPDVQLFDSFKRKWDKGEIVKDKFNSYFEGRKPSDKKSKQIQNLFSVSIKFIEAELGKKKQIRDDYQELLILARAFHGKEANLNIKKPGCTSRARWMQKAIYCLKMYLFRKQKSAAIHEVQLLENICLFIVFVYIPYWYDCTTALHTLQNDLDFIKSIKDFKNIDEKISAVAFDKFAGHKGGSHLWYMGYHLSALGFFDDRISTNDKRKMVEQLRKDNPSATEYNKRRFPFLEKEKNYEIIDFISKTTLEFFDIMKLDKSFFEKDPADWENDESYQKSKEAISYLHVVNDAGERALSNIKKITARKEEKIQNIIITNSYNRIKEKENVGQ